MKHSNILMRAVLVSLMGAAPLTLTVFRMIESPAAVAANRSGAPHLLTALGSRGSLPYDSLGAPPDSVPDTTAAGLAARFTQIQSRLPALEALLTQCRKRGIPTAYEVVDYTTIQHFIPWGQEDINGHREDAVQIAASIEQLYQEATANLQAYLAGTKRALAAPQYVTQQPEIAGYSFLGDMRWPDGRIEHHRPIFYIGHGVGPQVMNGLPYFTGFGANIVQFEWGPSNVIFPAGSLDWGVGGGDTPWQKFQVDPTVAHTGAQSLRISNPEKTGKDTAATASLPLVMEPHSTYRVRAWVKGNQVSAASLSVYQLTDGSDSPAHDDPGLTHALPDGTYGWRQVAFTFTTGPDHIGGLTIRTEGGTDALWLDDLQVSKAGSPENLVPDPGFEEIPVHTATGYYASQTLLKAELLPVLALAAQHNVAVDLLLSPHYWPGFLHNDYTQMYDPQVKAVLALDFQTIIPLIKNSPALLSVCLTNEAGYGGSKGQLPAWHEYLQHVYGNLSHLNTAYGAHYAQWADVPIQPVGWLKYDGSVTDIPAWQHYLKDMFSNVTNLNTAIGAHYAQLADVPIQPLQTDDWNDFLDIEFANWHRWMSDTIHQIAPGMRVHAKIQGRTGIDFALFPAFTQISGFDEGTGGLSDPNNYLGYTDWIDHMGSLHVAPLFDSEDHILQSGGGPAPVRLYLWQGALHGRNASTIWVWLRHAEDNLLQRPKVVASIGTTALDLNRLAKEVTAVHAAPAQVAILWSWLRTGPVTRRGYSDSLAFNLYGQKTDWITEGQVAEGNLSHYKLLVLPQAQVMTRATLEGIRQFVAAGGNVMIIGPSDSAGPQSMQLDEFRQPLPDDARSAILAHAVYLDTALTDSALAAAIRSNLDRLGLTQARLLDAATGQPVEEVEWHLAPFGNHLLLSVTNFTEKPKQVYLEVQGRRIDRAQELIGATAVEGPLFHLDGLTPYLFELPASEAR